jgi:hypothetical protein
MAIGDTLRYLQLEDGKGIISNVNEYTYLGVKITKDGNCEPEINDRINIGRAAIFFFFFLYHYDPFSFALASFMIDAHSSLSNAIVLHRFTQSSLKSSSTSFIHLSLGCPLPLRPSNFPSKIFTDLVSFFLTTCPSHSNLRIFITFTIGRAAITKLNSILWDPDVTPKTKTHLSCNS